MDNWDSWRDETAEHTRISTHMDNPSCSFWDNRPVVSTQIDCAMNNEDLQRTPIYSHYPEDQEVPGSR